MSELSSRLNQQFTVNFDEELIVDNFAGGGGASTAIYMATGKHPHYAINHNAEALAIHEANHPGTIHIKTDIWEYNPRLFTMGRSVKFVWFSPDCTHFSNAKGNTPVKKEIRGLAWVSIAWAMVTDMKMFMMENVKEFTSWGPVEERDGKFYPVKSKKGETFDGFIKALTTGIGKDHPALPEIREFLKPFLKEDYNEQKILDGLGFKVEFKEQVASDYGAPTSRKRFFLIARRDGKKIVWPEKSHGDTNSAKAQKAELKPWRTAAEIIDWSIPTHSIFMTKEEAEARKLNIRRPLKKSTLRRIAIGLPKFVFNTAKPFIVNANHTSGDWRSELFRGASIDQALHTITSKNGFGVCEPEIAMLNTYYGGEAGESRAYGLAEPVRTITAGGSRHSLVATTLSPVSASFVARHYGGGKNGKSAQGTSLRAPLATVTAQDSNALVDVSVLPFVKRDFGQSIGSSIDTPLPTTMANGGGKSSLVCAHALKLKGTNYGYGADEPVQTITAGGTHHGVVETFMVDFYGNGRAIETNKPLHTQPTKDKFALVDIVCDEETKGKIQAVREFLAKYASDLGLTEKQMLGIVTIDGVDYQITDIKMRMLTPRELFTAQGFPEDYIIDLLMPVGKKLKKLSKKAQVKAVGNSVSPIHAAALIRANWDSTPEEELLGAVA